jgi:hypothetical protein
MKLRSSLILVLTVSGALGATVACGSDDSSSDDKKNGGDGGGAGAESVTGGAEATGGKKGGTGGSKGDTGGSKNDTGGSEAGGAGGEKGSGSACSTDCTDDGNPCTEDTCNEKTGKCGVPRTGNACDDGIFCNGNDTCDAGECSEHAGDPCSETSCNEGSNTCECAKVEHCPGEDLSSEKNGGAGEWGTIEVGDSCEYDSTCDEACSCSVAKTTYECVAGSCKATKENLIDTTCGSRDTDGTTCKSNGVFCDGTEKCASGSCLSDPTTVPACKGGPAYCYAPLDKCVTCVPGTFKCVPSGSDELTVECLSNGEWDPSSWNASCYASSSMVCDPTTGGCKSGAFHPKDRDFNVPNLLRDIPPLERGLRTGDVLDRAIASEFG